MQYHTRRPIMAVIAAHPIEQGVRTVAARLLATAPNLSAADQQMLRDLQRAARYPFKTLRRVAEIAATCPNEGDALALTEALSSFIRSKRARPRLSLVRTIEDETAAQAKADVAEVTAALHQNDPGLIAQGLSYLREHRRKLDLAIEAFEQKHVELTGAPA